MEPKWPQVTILAGSLVSILLITNPFIVQAVGEPPVIDVAEGLTNASVISFYNGTLIVVNEGVRSITLICNASYPVMWSMESLEQPWTSDTAAARNFTDFRDKSTYTYSMSVALNNYVRDHSISLQPQEYECQAVDADNNLKSKMVVVWQGTWSYWPWLNHTSERKVYWEPDGEEEILIPCYTVNMGLVSAELFVKSNESISWTMLGSDRNPKSPFARFERYVGFFLKPSVVQLYEEQVYECRGRTRSTKTEITPSPLVTKTEGSDEEYKYIESEDEILDGNSTLKNLTGNVDSNEEESVYTTHDLAPTVSFRLIKLNSTTTQFKLTRRKNVVNGVMSTSLSTENSNLILKRMNSSMVSCCIRPGYDDDSYTAENMVLYHKLCREPLMCLTEHHLLKKTYIYYWAKDDEVLSDKCRYINTTALVYPMLSTRSPPALYICHMRTDSRFTRREYNGDYELRLHHRNAENSYLLETINRPTEFLYYDKFYDAHSFSNATFYEGQSVKPRCWGNGFFHANGKVLEIHWKNGTTTIIGPEFGEVNVTTSMEQISCHLPVWNSSEWVTQSAFLNVKPSKSPGGPNGETYLVEKVEFFAGESRVLNCDMEGHPPATYSWALTSSIYSFRERKPRYYYLYDYHDMPQYEGQAPNYYSDPVVQNVTVSTYATAYVLNSTLPIPEQPFTCKATNVVGSASKAFIVRAKRPTLPKIVVDGRGITKVLFLHDENKFLNCTIEQGVPQPTFHWQKHNINITSSEHYETQVIGNSSVLTFRASIEYEDEGEYECIASNLAGSVSIRFHVRVREPLRLHNWYAFAFVLLTLVIIVLITLVAHVSVRKTKKIVALEMRAECSNARGGGSGFTLATDCDQAPIIAQ